jgi:gliding motility-associated-like protein
MLNYTSNSNSNINHSRLFADLTIDGVVTPLNVHLGTVVPGIGQRQLYGPFTWVCGQAMSLSRLLIVWKTNGDSTELIPYTCSTYSKSQCELPGSQIIAAPLAVQFTYSGCTIGTSSTINFTSTTNGGTPPYTYAWDFDSNGTTDSILENPTHIYNNTSNNSATLTVTDSMGLINTFIVPIVYPTEINLNPVVQAITCDIGSTASINLTPTGGSSPYTFLWNTGAVSEDLSGLGIGTYSVVVTDALGCTKNYSTTISPIVCCEFSVTCPTFQPLSLQCYDLLPSATTLTEAEFEALGNGDGVIGDDPCGVVEITASNSVDPGCNANVIRTYTVTEYADPNNNDIRDLGENTILNSTACNQTILINDTTDPIISVQAADLTVQCDGNGNIADLNTWLAANGGASASDVCSSVTWSNDFSSVSDGCGASGSVTVIFTATDDCGNETTTSATFTIQDNTDPIISVQAADLTVQCDGNGNIADLNTWLAANGGASASDVCSSVTWSNDFSSVSDGCGASGSVTVIFTATDDCGNETTTSATFTIQDNTDPIFTSDLPNDILVSCDAIPDPITISTSDNCDNDVDISISDQIIRDEESCAGNYSISRTWTITDDCGNSNSYTQTITVYDTAPPVLSTPLDEELSVSCSNVPEVPNLEFEDNCSGVANVIYSEVITTISNYQHIIVRDWFVSDNCGNSDNFTQTINVSVEDPFNIIPFRICTQEEPIDLFTILDDSVPTNGIWIDLSDTGGLNGSIFNPLNIPVGSYTLQYIVTIENEDCPILFDIYLNINNDCIVLPACDVVVYNAVSPNNDGLNDFFLIDGIDCYPNNTVEIYNKWGILIYETRGYDNNFKAFRGQSEGRSTLNKSEGVPDGTYYYILKYVDEENKTHDKAGYLYVSK